MTILVLQALISMSAVLTVAGGIYDILTHNPKPFIKPFYIIYFQPSLMRFMDATIGPSSHLMSSISQEKENIMITTRKQIEKAEDEIRFCWDTFLSNKYITPEAATNVFQAYQSEIQNNYINLEETNRKFLPCSLTVSAKLANLVPNFKPFFYHVPNYTSFALLGLNAIGLNEKIVEKNLRDPLIPIALQHEYGHQVFEHRKNFSLHQAGILKKRLKKDLKNKPLNDQVQNAMQFTVNALRKNRRIIFQTQELQADAFAATVKHIRPHHIKALRKELWNTTESKKHPSPAVRNHNLDLILKAYAKDNSVD